jgi:hypothetical protein
MHAPRIPDEVGAAARAVEHGPVVGCDGTEADLASLDTTICWFFLAPLTTWCTKSVMRNSFCGSVTVEISKKAPFSVAMASPNY